jgi:hypothetical protein
MEYDFYVFSTLCIRYSVNGEELTQQYCIRDTKDGRFWHLSPRDEDFEELEDYKTRILQYKKDKIQTQLGWIKTSDLFSEGKWLCVNSAKDLYLDFIQRIEIPEDSLIRVYKDNGYTICNEYDMFKLNEDDPSDYTEIVKNSKGKYVIRICVNCDNYSDGCSYCDNNSEESESESYMESEEEISEEELQRIREERERREAERKIEEERKKIEEERKKKEREEREKEEIRRSKEYEERRRKTQYMPTIDEAMCYNCQLENGIIDSSDVLHRCPKHIARFGIYRPVYNNDE